MKNIVVYKSKTGFAEKYANWIGEALDCPVKSINKVKTSELNQYDHIIYGGGLYASRISGLGKISKKITGKEITYFAVGSLPEQEAILDKIKKDNKLSGDNIFYMVGGINLDKLKFLFKFMMKKMKKKTELKTDKDQQDLDFLKAFESPHNLPQKEYVEKLVTYVKSRG